MKSKEAAANMDSDEDMDEDQLSEDLDSDEQFSYDEDEVDDENEGGVQRRKMPAHRGLILDEAEVDDAEEETTEAEEGFEEFMREEQKTHPNDAPASYGKKRLGKFIDLENQDQFDELAAKYEKRLKTGVYDDAPQGSNSQYLDKHKLLPGVDNPYLYIVKCQMGEERKTAFLLMRKALAAAHSKQPLDIKSVIQCDSIKGCIYVEAYKPAHVKQAIEKINALRYGLYNQPMVPINEMTDVLRTIKTSVILQPKSWVRFKRGLYAGDLGFVEFYDQMKHTAMIKLIPRLDYNDLATAGSSERVKKSVRPQPALFNQDLARKAKADVFQEGGFLICKGKRFKDGFIYKKVHTSSLISSGVNPTITEIKAFNVDLQDSELLNSLRNDKSEHYFNVGDIIEVIQGELNRLTGKILAIKDTQVFIQPIHEELHDPIELGIHEIAKIFKIGDHVKVIRGEHENSSGLIVSEKDNEIVIFSNISNKEIRVNSRDLQICTDAVITVDSTGQYLIGDLVQIDPSTVGVIIGIDKDSLTILNQFGNTDKVKSQRVSKKNPFSGIIFDSFDNQISIGNTVHINDGPYKDNKGKLKHAYRGFAFIQLNKNICSGNIIVTRNSNISLEGGANTSTTSTSGISVGGSLASPNITMSPKTGNTPKNSPSFVGLGRSPIVSRSGRMSGRDNRIIGSTVQIIKGYYKGHVGIVKDATDVLVRIELHSNCKTINVDREHYQIYSEDSTYNADSSAIGKTPFSQKTPQFRDKVNAGNRTPNQDGGKTPRHIGNATPAHDGSATPLIGSVWDVTNNTPGPIESFDDDDNSGILTMSSSKMGIDTSFTSPQFPALNSYNSVTDTPQSPYSSIISPSSSLPFLTSPGAAPYSITPMEDTTPSSIPSTASIENSPALVPLDQRVIIENGFEVLISTISENNEISGKYAVVVNSQGLTHCSVKVLTNERKFDPHANTHLVDRRLISIPMPHIGSKVRITNDGKILHGTLLRVNFKDGQVALDEKSKNLLNRKDEISSFNISNMTPIFDI